MYIKIILWLVAVVTGISTVYSLNCYLCVGPRNGGCAKANPNDLIKQRCVNAGVLTALPGVTDWELENEVDESFRVSCIQLLAIEPKTNVTLYDRSCVVVPSKLRACNYLAHFVTVKSCNECTRDYCNNNKTLGESGDF